MTREQFKDQITLNMNDNRTNTITQIYNALDIVLRYMVTKLNISSHIYEGAIRTTSGRFQYPLVSEARQVQGRFYIPESDEWLHDVDPDTFNERYPSPDSTGIPFVSVLKEKWPVRQQPHSVLRFVSDSASDTQAITVHGTSYGRYVTESVTLTGTTAVLTTNDYNKVYRLIAASAAVGTITATANGRLSTPTYPTVANAGATTVATITAGNTTPSDMINTGASIRIKMSTDVAGDRSQDVRIEGLGVDGTNNCDELELAETLTTDGTNSTTAVESNLVAFTSIRRITKSWNSTHRLLVTTDPGDIIIAEIGPNQRSVEYQQVAFQNVPDGKTISYRYTPNFMAINNDDDDVSDVVPEVYHQVIAEWAEKLVRGWHGDGKLGVATLENNPAFDRAIREIKQSSKPSTTDHIKVGSNWQRDQRRSLVWPIVHSSN